MANWAIVIGINEYWKPSLHLKGAVGDAVKMMRWLTDPKGGNVKPQKLFFLARPKPDVDLPLGIEFFDATSSNLTVVIDRLMKKSGGQGERLFFYFSGHGLVNTNGFENEQALVMADFSNVLTDKAVSFRSIHEYLLAARFVEQFYIVDACRNVLVLDHKYRISDLPQVGELDFTQSSPAQYRLFSTSPGLKSVEVQDKLGEERGAFTEDLLAGLRGKGKAKLYDPNADEYVVRVDRLFAYVEENVFKRKLNISPDPAKPIYQKPELESKGGGTPPELARLSTTEVERETLELIVSPDSVWPVAKVRISQSGGDLDETFPVTKAPLALDPLPPMTYTVRPSAPGHATKQRKWTFELYEPYRLEIEFTSTVGSSMGTAAGAATAAAIGTAVGGPGSGTLVGGAVDGFDRGLAGNGINSTGEDSYWRENYRSRPYAERGRDHEHYQAADKYGWESQAVGVGSGVGAAAGAATGAAIGTAVGGPGVGTLTGAAVGATAGGRVGRGIAEGINPTEEDSYWRENYRSRPYAESGHDYEHYQPAYKYGWEARIRYLDRGWDDVENDLSRDWDKFRGESRLHWNEARHAVRDAWSRVERTVPGDPGVGTLVGAAVGAVAGGLVGRGIAEGINPIEEDSYWRENYRSRPYAESGRDYDDYQPAYRYGWESRARHADKSWDQAENDLERGWDNAKGAARQTWNEAKFATRDAWHRVERTVPGYRHHGSQSSGHRAETPVEEIFSSGGAAMLRLRTANPLDSLEIVDQRGDLLATGEGALEAALQPGLYKARLVSPQGVLAEQPVELSPGEVEEVRFDARLPTAVVNGWGSLDAGPGVPAGAGITMTKVTGLDLMSAVLFQRERRNQASKVGILAGPAVGLLKPKSILQTQVRLWPLPNPVPDLAQNLTLVEAVQGISTLWMEAEDGPHWLALEQPGGTPIVLALVLLRSRFSYLVLREDMTGRTEVSQLSLGWKENSDHESVLLQRLELLQKFFLSEQWGHAKRNAEELDRRGWTDPITGCLIGYTRLHMGMTEKIEATVEHLVGAFGEVCDSHVLRAEILVLRERKVEAQEAFRKALDQGLPLFAEGLTRLKAAVDHYELQDHPRVPLLNSVWRQRARGLLWTAWKPEALVPGQPLEPSGE